MSFELMMYNSGNFPSYEEADKCEATYRTVNRIDSLTGTTGFLDIVESLNTMEQCLNNFDLVFGALCHGQFIKLDDVLVVMEETEQTPDTVIEVLAKNVLKSKISKVKFNDINSENSMDFSFFVGTSLELKVNVSELGDEYFCKYEIIKEKRIQIAIKEIECVDECNFEDQVMEFLSDKISLELH